MDLTNNVLGEGWYWAAWLIWLPLFARSVLKAPWRFFKQPELFNFWLGMIVVLTFVWSLKAGVKPGLSLHMLGANLFVLSCGPHLAFIGLSLVTLGITLNGAAGGFAFAANALLLAGCSVVIAQSLFSVLVNRLPRHFFVFIFVNGFISAALTVVGVGLCATVLMAFADAYALSYLLDEYFPYYILLGFSEAWLSGMFLTLFVIYRPAWVVTFDDSSYLSEK